MSRQPLWRSTPSAVFPAILGLVGLGLLWRGLAEAFGFTTAIGDIFLGVSAAALFYFSLAYLAKFLARPGVLAEDLRAPPGRAGLSALSMAYIVLAAGLLPFGLLAAYIWWFGLLLNAVILVYVLIADFKTRAGGRSATPFQYFTYAGLSTAPLAGVALGYSALSQALGYITLLVFVFISLKIGAKFLRSRPPAPLRPPLVMLLAPLGLFALAFGQFGPEILFLVFYILAWGVAIVLLVFARWLTIAGFTPIWGMLGFSLAVFTNMNLMAIDKGFGTIATTGAIAGALIGTPLILFIAFRVAKMWAKRDLAKKTGAAVA